MYVLYSQNTFTLNTLRHRQHEQSMCSEGQTGVKWYEKLFTCKTIINAGVSFTVNYLSMHTATCSSTLPGVFALHVDFYLLITVVCCMCYGH